MWVKEAESIKNAHFKNLILINLLLWVLATPIFDQLGNHWVRSPSKRALRARAIFCTGKSAFLFLKTADAGDLFVVISVVALHGWGPVPRVPLVRPFWLVGGDYRFLADSPAWGLDWHRAWETLPSCQIKIFCCDVLKHVLLVVGYKVLIFGINECHPELAPQLFGNRLVIVEHTCLIFHLFISPVCFIVFAEVLNDLEDDLLSLLFFRSRGQMWHLGVIWHEWGEANRLLGCWVAEYRLSLRLYGEVTSSHSWVFWGATNLFFHEWNSWYKLDRRHWIVIKLVARMEQAISAKFATFSDQDWRDTIACRFCFEKVRLRRLLKHRLHRLWLHCMIHQVGVCWLLWWLEAIHV